MASLGSPDTTSNRRRARMRPVDFAQLFRTAKAAIADDELAPLRHYRQGSLEDEFDSRSRTALRKVVKKWKEGNDPVLPSLVFLVWTASALAILSLSIVLYLSTVFGIANIDFAPVLAAFVSPYVVSLCVLVNMRRIKNTLDTREQRRGQLDQAAATALQLVLSEIKTDYNLHTYPWRMGVPNYQDVNPCRFLVERHDDYSPTKLFTKAQEYVQTHDRGSIGIAGERGSGKTSMMQELKRRLAATSESDDELQTHTVWMSVPTRVEEKEFLVSVLAKLATSVGAKLTRNTAWPDDAPEERLNKQDARRRGARLAIVVGFLVVVAFVLLRHLPTASGDLLSVAIWSMPLDSLSSQAPGPAEFQIKNALALVGAIALGLALWPAIRAVGPRYSHVKPKTQRALVSASQDLLEELWYERTEGRATRVGWTDFGMSLGAGLSMQRTRNPLTLPHLVDMWEQYLAHLTKDQGVFKKVVVFIDEIDKLKDADRIKECLLILKALYNAPNVIFVVSISEDAYRLFRKRSSSFEGRNAFDSTLDKVLLVRKVTVGELRDLINRRMLGYAFSSPVTQLVWMLSKGNPRDAIRLARDIPEQRENGGLRGIGEIAWQLCPEMIGKTFAEYQELSNEGELWWNEGDGFRFGNTRSPEEFGDELREAITRVQAHGGGVSRSLLLAELKYVQTIWEEYGVRREWRRCVVADLYSRCRRRMQEVQNHLSNGEADEVLRGLEAYSSAMHQGVESLEGDQEVAWAKLEERELQHMLLGLLDNGNRTRSEAGIREEMKVHANGMRIGKALEELEERGFLECEGGACDEVGTAGGGFGGGEDQRAPGRRWRAVRQT